MKEQEYIFKNKLNPNIEVRIKANNYVKALAFLLMMTSQSMGDYKLVS